MHKNLGEIAIEDCDEMNVPVHAFLSKNDAGKWEWTADNYMPRKGYINQSQYEVVADTEEELMQLIQKYVVPLYEAAIASLKQDGNLYYWQLTTASE